ncbi:hypothetical protein [uncultured Gimesia sp.]|uniref:hypothetical protein n=1 Tax=uncultured Gimesia sp. TaxID=1678688 RepID=UPI0030D9908F|tara:strand:+ start:202478 stop:202828 length:351 start_codon:yes stop_codon:yes gene_type:complete
MNQAQDPRFKRYLQLAYGIFWGGVFSTMLILYLTELVFKINSDPINIAMAGSFYFFLLAGSLLLFISHCHLKLCENKVLNLILGSISFIIQAGINAALLGFIWLFFLFSVMKIGFC